MLKKESCIYAGSGVSQTPIAYLEQKGAAINHASAKRNEDGSIYVIYLQNEIAGFAIQLINK